MRRTLLTKHFLAAIFFVYLVPVSIAQENTQELTVAVLSNWPPQYLTDEKTGKPTGFAIDVIEEIAKRSHLKLRYKVYDSWPQINRALLNKEADIIPNHGITEERKENYDYTVPVETFNISIFVRKSTVDIHSINDLRGRKVGVVETNKARYLMEERGVFELIVYGSLEKAFLSLLSGAVEALVYPEPVLNNLAQNLRLGDRIQTIGEPIFEVKRAIALRKGYPALRDKLDISVQEFVNSPTYKTIYKKWYKSPEPYWNLQRLSFVFAAVFTISLTIILLWRYVSVTRLINKAKILAKFPSESPNPILRVDKNGLINYANSSSVALLRHWNCTEGSLLPEECCNITAKVLANGSPETIEIISGEQAFSITFSPVQDASSVNLYGLDITARKYAEQALHRYEYIVANSSDMMALIDNDFVYLAANDAYAKAFGIPKEEIIGLRVADIFDEQFFTDVIRPNAEQCFQGKNVSYEELFHFSNNETRYMDVAYSPYIGTDGIMAGFIVVARDISSRKQAEKEKEALEHKLRQTHKMEAIGTLAGGIAHDFNNILAVIIGYAEFIQEELPKESQAKEDVQHLIAATYRATHLVRQILTFSRKTDTNKQPLELHLLVKETMKMLRATIPTSIVIDEDIDPNCGTILADSTNIYQVLVNLCTNARHAMAEEKGILRVKLCRKELSTEKIPPEEDISAGPFAILSVSDSGCGIRQENLDRIFEPYFTTKGTGEGTGLGLSVVHGIVQECNGFIEVESTLGKGSTFSVFFPCIKEPHLEPTGIDREKKAIKPQADIHILMVDDEPLLVRINKRRLQSEGYRVTAMIDSREALQLFRDQPDRFDLLITDQTMPGLTGADLVKAMLKIKPSLPIIVCTGHSDSLSKEKALSMGIKKYVYKPIMGDELFDAVREVLDKQ